jgi:hypothetical protein
MNPLKSGLKSALVLVAILAAFGVVVTGVVVVLGHFNVTGGGTPPVVASAPVPSDESSAKTTPASSGLTEKLEPASPTSEGVSLELVSANAERETRENGGIWVRGEVKNVTGESLEWVKAVVTLRTGTGQYVTTESMPIDYMPLLAGQKSPFSVVIGGNPAIATWEVSFKDGRGPHIAHSDARHPAIAGKGAPAIASVGSPYEKFAGDPAKPYHHSNLAESEGKPIPWNAHLSYDDVAAVLLGAHLIAEESTVSGQRFLRVADAWHWDQTSFLFEDGQGLTGVLFEKALRGPSAKAELADLLERVFKMAGKEGWERYHEASLEERWLGYRKEMPVKLGLSEAGPSTDGSVGSTIWYVVNGSDENYTSSAYPVPGPHQAVLSILYDEADEWSLPE